MHNLLSEDPSLQGFDSGEQFNFKCKYCNRNLSSRQNLREHNYIHTGVRPYKCPEPGCLKTFRQGSLMSIHRKTHKNAASSSSSASKGFQKLTYLKLTDCFIDRSIDFPVTECVKESILADLGDQKFKFIQQFL